MIKTVTLKVNAAHPEIPLEAVSVFAGSAASFTIIDVPRAVGKRAVTGVSLVYRTKTGGSATTAAVRVGSAFEVTIPASALADPYSATLGLKIVGIGTDENAAACQWTLGVADLFVLNAQGQVTPGSEAGDIRHADFEDVTVVGDRFTLNDLKGKVNQVLTILKGTTAALAVMLALPLVGEVQTAQLGDLYNDSLVVTNVTGGGIDTQAVTNIVEGYNYVTAAVTNGLAANYAAVSNAAMGAVQKAEPFLDGWPTKYVTIQDQGHPEYQPELNVGGVRFEIPAFNDVSWNAFSWATFVIPLFEFYNVESAYGKKFTLATREWATDNFATDARVTAVSNRVDAWETYWRGDRVRLSVTNYYGNSTGEPPRLRIEESETNGVGEIIGYRIVWDEVTRQTNYQQQVDVKLNDISNNVMMATFRQTNNQLANKAPRAWGTVTSSGESAPANTVWHTAPNTVFAGGTEYAHVAVGEGSICVLVDKGAGVFTEGEAGQFRFKDESGENYFGFDVRESYTLGCRTDGISVTTVGGNKIITLTYDVTSASDPEIMTCSDLLAANWSEVTEVEWEQNPPAGCKICYINAGPAPTGFYKAQMTYPGGSKFVTNMQADLQGGITATNEALNVWQSVYPVITATGIVWRVKQ